MTIPEISTLTLIGSGLMGWQIGLVCARAGYTTRLHDIRKDAMENARQQQAAKLEEWAAAGELDEPAEAVLDRISYHPTADEAVAGAQFVLETVTEDLEMKRQVFAELDRICPPAIPIATNSSSIQSSRVVAGLKNPERVMNMHFLNHPWLRPYVETMTCGQTRDEYLEIARRLGKSLGLASVRIHGEVQGFVFNRLWRAIKKEAMFLADEGLASIGDIDRAFMIGLRAEKGVFQMMDRAGLHIQLAIEKQWYAESGHESDRPRAVLTDRVERGDLGMPSGKGFYSYPDPSYEEAGWLFRGDD